MLRNKFIVSYNVTCNEKNPATGKLARERPKRVVGDSFSEEVMFEDPKEENSRVQGLEVTTGWR